MSVAHGLQAAVPVSAALARCGKQAEPDEEGCPTYLMARHSHLVRRVLAGIGPLVGVGEVGAWQARADRTAGGKPAVPGWCSTSTWTAGFGL
jgi:hypothetical protein